MEMAGRAAVELIDERQHHPFILITEKQQVSLNDGKRLRALFERQRILKSGR